MFGAGTARYFDELPTLRELDAPGARRLLSSAYADVLTARDGLSRIGAEELPIVRARLRRLASALEAHAVLVEGLAAQERAAASFVSAEAMSLLLDLPVVADEDEGEPDVAEPRHRLETLGGLQAIECGLLYLAAGFDSNAAVAARTASRVEAPSAPQGEAFWAERAYRALIAVLQLFPRSPIVRLAEPTTVPEPSDWPDARVRSELYRRVERAATDYLRWLSFEPQVDEAPPSERVKSLAALLRAEPSPRYAGVAHVLVLLGAAIEATMVRALRQVPALESETFGTYLRERASVRPLVWPSTAEYARACLPGPNANGVVALPTGSGKSFTAELAAAEALAEGWVLYLVPTNALAAQVRRDLTRDLDHLEGTRIRAFLGDGQYTELGEETVTDVGPGSLLVMTPEKCALALRRSPEAFQGLRLCVFDECHQMREAGGRGAIAELVVSHVMTLAPECRFLLLSALVSNASEVAAWLSAATGRRSEAISSPWRPTRTLRAVVGFDHPTSRAASERAMQELSAARETRKNWKFPAKYAVLANLQGAWSDTHDANYVALRLPVDGELQWHRDRVGIGWEYRYEPTGGYVNRVVGDLASFFATAGEKVLAFLPANRHHPFAVAEQLDLSDLEFAPTEDDISRVAALLDIADWELGVASVLREIIERGAAVHTSSVIDAERQASEIAFRGDQVAVMLATGTLAQGLNLPATMVIVGGTDVGDRRESRTAEGRLRSLAQLLNAIGRAGRPNVAARSVALVVPSSPLWINEGPDDVEDSLAQAEVLAREDAAVALTSPLETLIRSALADAVSGEGMSLDELTAFTYLPITEGIQPSARSILARSFGVWRQQPQERDTTANVVANALGALGQRFVEGAEVPSWTAGVAHRSGLSLPEVFALYRSTLARLDAPRESLADWADLFGAVMRDMPPHLARGAIDAERMPAGASFSHLRNVELSVSEWQAGWDALFRVLKRYMAGATLADVARTAFQIDGDVPVSRSAGNKPLPKTIGLLDRTTYGLSMVGGGLAALFATAGESETNEHWTLSEGSRVSLEMLPLAIRNGCGDRSSLSWFRFGLRHRRVAHLLAALVPVPDTLETDEQIETWITLQRDQWVESLGDIVGADAVEGGIEVLRAARRVLAWELTGS